MADQEVKIDITTQANSAGAEQAAKALETVKTQTEQAAAATRDLAAANEQAAKAQQELKAASESSWQPGASVPDGLAKSAHTEEMERSAREAMEQAEEEAQAEARAAAEAEEAEKRRIGLLEQRQAIMVTTIEMAQAEAADDAAEASALAREIEVRKIALQLQTQGQFSEKEALVLAEQRVAALETIAATEEAQSLLNAEAVEREAALLAIERERVVAAAQQVKLAEEQAVAQEKLQASLGRAALRGVSHNLGLGISHIGGGLLGIGAFLAISKGLELAIEKLKEMKAEAATTAQELTAFGIAGDVAAKQVRDGVAETARELAALGHALPPAGSMAEQALKGADKVVREIAGDVDKAISQIDKLRKSRDDAAEAEEERKKSEIELDAARGNITPEEAERRKSEVELAGASGRTKREMQAMEESKRVRHKMASDATDEAMKRGEEDKAARAKFNETAAQLAQDGISTGATPDEGAETVRQLEEKRRNLEIGSQGDDPEMAGRALKEIDDQIEAVKSLTKQYQDLHRSREAALQSQQTADELQKKAAQGDDDDAEKRKLLINQQAIAQNKAAAEEAKREQMDTTGDGKDARADDRAHWEGQRDKAKNMETLLKQQLDDQEPGTDQYDGLQRRIAEIRKYILGAEAQIKSLEKAPSPEQQTALDLSKRGVDQQTQDQIDKGHDQRDQAEAKEQAKEEKEAAREAKEAAKGQGGAATALHHAAERLSDAAGRLGGEGGGGSGSTGTPSLPGTDPTGPPGAPAPAGEKRAPAEGAFGHGMTPAGKWDAMFPGGEGSTAPGGGTMLDQRPPGENHSGRENGFGGGLTSDKKWDKMFPGGEGSTAPSPDHTADLQKAGDKQVKTADKGAEGVKKFGEAADKMAKNTDDHIKITGSLAKAVQKQGAELESLKRQVASLENNGYNQGDS